MQVDVEWIVTSTGEFYLQHDEEHHEEGMEEEDLVTKAEKEFFETIEHERKLEERKRAQKGADELPKVCTL